MPVPSLHIFVCTNERDGKPSCRGTALVESFKAALDRAGADRGTIRVNRAGCLGQCAQGPTVVIYPVGTWYGHVTETDVEEIVREHIVNGRTVERLLLPR